MAISVQQVLALAVVYAGRDDLKSSLTDTKNADVQKFLDCFNYIENEIALDYFPITYTQRITVTDGKIIAGKFLYHPVRILGVYDPDGNPLKYKLGTEALSVFNADGKEVQIVYCYSPNTKSLSGATDFYSPVSARLLASGVAGLYLASRGAYKEAEFWQKRYMDALKRAHLFRHSLSVRSRRWV